MKAVRVNQYGGTEVLEYGDFPMPSVGDHDVLVRVLATTVSRYDIKFRKGEIKDIKTLPGRTPLHLPWQPGRDAVGIVESVGQSVKMFKPGDQVVGLTMPANPASPMTMRGLSNLSTGADLPGHAMFGGGAQFVSRPESYWLHLPANVKPEAAAAAMWAYTTSHRIMTSRLDAKVGDTVLVVGGTGGMGSATLDIAKAMGVRTIAVTRSQSKVDLLKSFGASETLVIPDEQIVEKIRALAGGMGVDGFVDFSASADMMRLGVDTIRPGGTLVISSHVETGPQLPIFAYDCVRLELNIKGVRGATLHDQMMVLKLLENGSIQPKIHAVMPLSEISKAHKLMENDSVTGRIVLDPWA